MAFLAILFGAMLGLLGPILYELSEPASQSLTAFIPSIFGVLLILCGVIAYNEQYRKHAMHAAALVGVLGIVMPLGRLIYAMTKPEFKFGLAAGGTLLMSALCAIFVGLCVKSFIDARKARKLKEAEAQMK